MTTFVLIPGAWLGGWAFDDVASRLREAGHAAHPVTLTGLGDRAAEASPGTDLETHVADVIRLTESRDLREVTLVGHSYGGLVAQVVADRIPERFERVVYLDTGPLPDGWSMLDFMADQREELERTVAERGDGWRLPFPGVDGLGTPSAIAGIGPSERRLLEERAVDQPFGTYRQGVSVKRPFRGEYERVVIVAGGFGLPLDQLRPMVGPDGPFGAMTDPDWQAVELATGHWPMLTDAARLAELLDQIAHGSAPLEPLAAAEARR